MHKAPSLQADIRQAVMSSDPRLSLSGPDGNTQLHYAAQVGDWPEVEQLLQQGADIDAKNAEGETPLWAAVRAGEETGYAKFRRFEFRSDQVNAEGETLLHAAVKGRNVAILKDLLSRCRKQRPAFIDETHGSMAPLDIALHSEDPDCTLGVSQALLEAGAERPYGQRLGVEACMAIENGNLTRASVLLDALPRRRELRPYWVMMVKHATQVKSPEMVEKILGMLVCDDQSGSPIFSDKTWVDPNELHKGLEIAKEAVHEPCEATQTRILAIIEAKEHEVGSALTNSTTAIPVP